MSGLKRRQALAAIAAVVWFAVAASPAASSTVANEIIGLDAVSQVLPTLDGMADSSGVAQRVAIVDTGIDFDHAYLGGKVIGGINMAANATWGSNAPSAYDDRNGHGTFVAGVIGSTHPQRSGIAPGAEFVAVRVLAADGNGSLLDLAMGLEWVADHAAALNITTVNVSIGIDRVFEAISDVPTWSTYRRIEGALNRLESLDIVTVASSGNDGESNAITMPAIYESVIATGATNQSGGIASFSNRSNDLDMLAPGSGIESLWKNDGLSTGSGTSYASPMVAGTAVLIREAIEQFTTDLNGGFASFADRVAALLQSTGRDVIDPATGATYQQLDVYAAIAEVYEQYGEPLPQIQIPEPATLVVLGLGFAILARGRHQATRSVA